MATVTNHDQRVVWIVANLVLVPTTLHKRVLGMSSEGFVIKLRVKLLRLVTFLHLSRLRSYCDER